MELYKFNLEEKRFKMIKCNYLLIRKLKNGLNNIWDM